MILKLVNKHKWTKEINLVNSLKKGMKNPALIFIPKIPN